MAELMRLDVEDGVACLQFLKPEQRNPYSIQFVEELVLHLDEASRRDDIRALVMTGNAHFSSGGDLHGFQNEIVKGARATQNLLDLANQGVRAAYNFPKPLIAGVEGVCYGGGMSLALCADFIICSSNAKFCQVFAQVGGCPDTGSSWLLQKRAGSAVAKTLVLTAREIDGSTAVSLGIADEVTGEQETLNRAKELAREISKHPQFGVMTAKRVLRDVASTTFDAALEIEGRAQSLLLCAHDFPEAMTAFRVSILPEFNDK